MTYLLVGLGGGLGAMCRYAISSIPVKSVFPVLTLLVNFLGAVLIGVTVEWLDHDAPDWTSPLLKTGFCGGFTTFSTFSLEALLLWQGDRRGLAVLYAVTSVVLCVAGVLLGRMLMKRVRL